MLKNMKIWLKITLGFSVILLLALFLGGMAVLRMKMVGNDTSNLVNIKVPQIKYALELDDNVYTGMYAMRRYNYTYEENELEIGKREFNLAKQQIEALKKLNEKYPEDTPVLAHKLPEMEKSVIEYIKLIDESEKTAKELVEYDKIMKENEQIYIKAVLTYIKAQEIKLEKEIKDKNTKVEDLLERKLKVKLGNEGMVRPFWG